MINHGSWTQYVPESRPTGAPPNALFWKNEAGEDWYDKLRSIDVSAIKVLVLNERVVCAGLDASTFVPLGTLYELPSGSAVPDAADYFYDGGFHKTPKEPANPYLPLKPYQFWGAVRATGHEIDLHTWVDTIADPVQKGIASAMLEFSLEFRRDHPLIEAARIHLGMTETELNDLWLWGLTL